MTEQARVKYLTYIQNHTENVVKAYRWLCTNKVISEVFSIDPLKTAQLISQHDHSKLSDAEFTPYANYFYGACKNQLEFNKAWNQHQKCNPHHWQYWILIEDDPGNNRFKCLPMENEYIVEMICDWWSFSWNSGNLYEIFTWYEKNKLGIMLHPDTKEAVEQLLLIIRKKLDLTAEEI